MNARPGDDLGVGLPVGPRGDAAGAPSHAAYLPPVPRPPHDPYTLILDGRLGWRPLGLDSVVAPLPIARAGRAAQGALGLVPLPVYADGSLDLGPRCLPPTTGARVCDPVGEPLAAPPVEPARRYPMRGTWHGAALDSGISECVWDRILISALVPEDTRLQVDVLTAETLLTPDALVERGDWRTALTLAGGPEQDGNRDALDFMLSAAPGRFLWLRLTFSGQGPRTPLLRRLAIDYPRIGLRRYLPAVFGREPVAAEVMDRWLAVLEHSLRGIETHLDTQARLFDPRSAPAEGHQDFLGFLARWVGVSGIAALPLARRRAFIRAAPHAYAWRGTPWGLTRSLYLFLGLPLGHTAGFHDRGNACVPCTSVFPARYRWRPPRLILEHFRLRRWLWLGTGRLSDNARLWGERIVNRSRLGGGAPPAGAPGCPRPGGLGAGAGCSSPAQTAQANPGGRDETARLGVTQLKTTQDPWRDPFHVYAHRLSVFIPAARLCEPRFARALANLIETEIPGQVQADLIPVEPRFRVGVQAMLGLDAVIGYRAAPPALDGMELGRGTVLGDAAAPRRVDGSTGDGGARSLRVGTRRVGMDTTL